jgi:hexosaminidase
MTSFLPQPRHVRPLEGTVTWESPLRIDVPEVFVASVKLFASQLSDATGWDVELTSEDPHIVVRVSGDAPEGYGFSIANPTVITASDSAGLYYALNTIRQLFPAGSFAANSTLSSVTLPCMDVSDSPSFAWRGVHLDVARHFFTRDEVCRLIDLISLHRLNRLHLHLNDDQGWRVEVPTWPLLTEIGSKRTSSPLGHNNDGLDDGVAHDGFYTHEDLVAIREYARERHITIVPEIDLPGHAQAVLAAYPELGNGTGPYEVWTRWGISEQVLNVSPEAIAFAEEVVMYVADIFPGSPVHIGGDECPSTEWAQSSDAQAVMREHGFSDPQQLQGLYTTRLASTLRKAGHDVLAWDEVLDAEVPEGTIIAAWRSSKKGTEAAKRGLDVVMAPMQLLYLDWLSSDREGEPVAQTFAPHITTWEKVYSFNPIPRDLPSELAHHIRGAQVQLWTEYISSVDHLDYMAFPRTCAFSEVIWGTGTTTEAFRPRLVEHLERLEAMGVAFRPLDSDA